MFIASIWAIWAHWTFLTVVASFFFAHAIELPSSYIYLFVLYTQFLRFSGVFVLLVVEYMYCHLANTRVEECHAFRHLS